MAKSLGQKKNTQVKKLTPRGGLKTWSSKLANSMFVKDSSLTLPFQTTPMIFSWCCLTDLPIWKITFMEVSLDKRFSLFCQASYIFMFCTFSRWFTPGAVCFLFQVVVSRWSVCKPVYFCSNSFISISFYFIYLFLFFLFLFLNFRLWFIFVYFFLNQCSFSTFYVLLFFLGHQQNNPLIKTPPKFQIPQFNW